MYDHFMHLYRIEIRAICFWPQEFAFKVQYQVLCVSMCLQHDKGYGAHLSKLCTKFNRRNWEYGLILKYANMVNCCNQVIYNDRMIFILVLTLVQAWNLVTSHKKCNDEAVRTK